MMKKILSILFVFSIAFQLLAQTEVEKILEQAQIEYALKRFQQAANLCEAVLRIEDSGEAHLLLGKCYVSSTRECGKNPFEQRVVICLAMDEWEKAKGNEEARRLLERYELYLIDEYDIKWKPYIPNLVDNQYKISCWINKQVTIRYRN